MTKLIGILGMAAVLVACTSRREVTSLARSTAGEPETLHSVSSERVRWEQSIRIGITEKEFLHLIEEDPWASGWIRLPRTMTGPKLLVWAKSRKVFVGGIHEDPALQKAISGGDTYRVYSSQGIPSTTSQLTVVLAADQAAEWRVVYRAVRPRPCF